MSLVLWVEVHTNMVEMMMMIMMMIIIIMIILDILCANLKHYSMSHHRLNSN